MTIDLAPAAMAAFERLAHHVDVADALERVVGAADLVDARSIRSTMWARGRRRPPSG